MAIVGQHFRAAGTRLESEAEVESWVEVSRVIGKHAGEEVEVLLFIKTKRQGQSTRSSRDGADKGKFVYFWQ